MIILTPGILRGNVLDHMTFGAIFLKEILDTVFVDFSFFLFSPVNLKNVFLLRKLYDVYDKMIM